MTDVGRCKSNVSYDLCHDYDSWSGSLSCKYGSAAPVGFLRRDRGWGSDPFPEGP